MSKLSRWLRPPVRKTRIIDFARGAEGVRPPTVAAAWALAASIPGIPSPRKPRTPLEELPADDAERMLWGLVNIGHLGGRSRRIERGARSAMVQTSLNDTRYHGHGQVLHLGPVLALNRRPRP